MKDGLTPGDPGQASCSLGGAVDGGQVVLGHGDDAELGEEGDPGWLDARAGVELAVSELPVRVGGGAGGELLGRQALRADTRP